ncbi:ATP-binding protein [Jiangella anatolica]|uniref:Uncharacterized protein n=1 Tax=Jiangella anatolica TaxID=2670374 RepID=A0A2W2BNT6_9ACTN|nr:tetratricopeptide repeat protein [Jiangella anatolica]PZF81994.1 hypothetical protein C1I92_18875 [Jiangella anatolica]
MGERRPQAVGLWTLDDLAAGLARLRVWAGSPSFSEITRRVAAHRVARGVRGGAAQPGRVTVYDAFQPGRRRVDAELVGDIVAALGLSESEALTWRLAAGRAMGAVPEQLVPVSATVAEPVPEFTGRGRELVAIADARADAVTLITGMAGVGKTELALRAAAVLRSRTPGLATLFVDLRGFEPDGAPLTPGSVLVAMLRLLGEDDPRWRADAPEALAVQCRRRLADRPHLVVLDNAGGEEQLAPLLAATTPARVLVTSRLALPGLDEAVRGRGGPQRIGLEPFTDAESLELFRTMAGAERVDAEPEAALEIARADGRLPLALGITARRIAARPDWTLAELAHPLRKRLDGLRLEPDVDTSLALSYRGLPRDDQRFVRLLPLHPGQHLDAPAAAALAGIDVEAAADRLAELADQHLVRRSAPGTFGLHDLVRAQLVAASLDEDRPAERSAAVARLFDHYRLAVARMAQELEQLGPALAGLPLLPADPPDGGPRPSAVAAPADRAAAVAWLDAKAAALVALIQDEYASEHAEATVALVLLLTPYLNLRTDLQVVLDLHLRARDAAERYGDPVVVAATERNIGGTWLRIGDMEAGRRHLAAAAELFGGVGHELGLAQALNSLAIVHAETGDFAAAVEGFRTARDIYQRHGEERRARMTADNLAVTQQHTGQLEEGLAHFEKEVAICRRNGERDQEVMVLTNAAAFCLQLGRFADARHHSERGVELALEIGDRMGAAYHGHCLSEALAALGEFDAAERRLQDALELARELGDRGLEARLHSAAGVAARYRGDLDEAERAFTAARDLAAELSDPIRTAVADEGLAAVRCARGDREGAREVWARTGESYRSASEPSARRVLDHLAQLDAGADCGCARPDAPLVVERGLTRV